MCNEFANPRPWADRRNSLQPFSFEGDDLSDVLFRLTAYIRDKGADLPTDGKPKVDGVNSNTEICLRALRTIGLVERSTESSWIITDEGKQWLDGKDAFYLVSVICANVKYTGELLQQLVEYRKESDLLTIANSQYGMHWTGLSQISERNKWFRQLGLVECESHTHEYRLSESGFRFLKTIDPMQPLDAKAESVSLENDEWLPEDWALDLCKMTANELANRRWPIGRPPKGKGGVVDLLSATVLFLEEPKARASFDDFILRQGVSGGSVQAFRSFVQRFGFVKKGRGGYRSTASALEWASSARPIDLCCYAHSVLAFTFEILQELAKDDRTRKDLIARVATVYGVRLTEDNLRCRLIMLESANLIWTDSNVVGITERGRSLLPLVMREPAASANKDAVKGVQSGMERKFSPELLDMETELRIAATDSSHPKRFEIACMRAFAMLGFESEQIGGPADTDVLLTGQIGTSDTYAVCVDAKTSASGSVDSNIKFVPLKNHRDKHGAKYSVVIGARFGKSTQEGDFAEGNAVVFMGVDMLCKLLEKHEATPLSTGEYRRLFEMSGKVEDDDLESLFAASERKQRILKYLLRALSSPIVINQYGGFCNIDEIKILMIQSGLSAANGGSKLEDEITDVISFLSHPMINVIEENRERYRLTGSLRDLTMKLSCYTDARIEL